MSLAKTITIFLIANIIGFMAAPIVYNAAALTNTLPFQAIEANPTAFEGAFFTGTIMTWLFCAIASIGFFLIEGKLRWVFLLIAPVAPILYGLNVLNGFGAG